MKRFLLEGIGTFFLALAVVVTGNPLAIGLILMTITSICMTISYAHFNPAVSIAAFFLKKISKQELLFCIGAQTVGACTAAMIFALITRSPFSPDIIPGIPLAISALLEFGQTMLFCTLVFSTMNKHTYGHTGLEALIIGLTLAALGFIGGIFNPAIGVAGLISMIFSEGFALTLIQPLLVFVLMPLIAGMVAALIIPSLE